MERGKAKQRQVNNFTAIAESEAEKFKPKQKVSEVGKVQKVQGRRHKGQNV